MDTRRDFLKKAALLAGATGFTSVLPPSIQRALAIDPLPGTTWLDAEHVVILMQENRSFDHCFGALKGVRGFQDPRAITLADKNPVWLQTNAAGETFSPFRLDIKGTNATWMGSLPHSWSNQQDARHEGKCDQWLQAKHSGQKEYAHMPLTLGHYDRRDIPFYYALADAFTVCDQNFCSSLTGTTPNRLYLWTGTVREELHPNVKARVRNGDTDYGVPASWTTFPERLEDHGVDWRIYQNEISLDTGFQGEEDPWLANFTDNPIEWFAQHRVEFSPEFMKYMPVKIEALKAEIAGLQKKIAALPSGGPDIQKQKSQLAENEAELKLLEEARIKFTPEAYAKLSQREKNLYTKAFTTNRNDPDYRKLTTLKYQDGTTAREVQVPKGDVLHQFREDVKDGKLPTVSWLVAPENFSDHPGAPWYGAWYVSEVMDILTKNPEVWKKTIFVLCYDENDGYFDHIPPFVAPDPSRPETGKVSQGIDAGLDYVPLEQDLKYNSKEDARGGPIGLGFRVPLVIASPWSRGGFVNSQVCDHTSILQMMEKLISHRSGRKIEQTNITAWRRTVCGDLSSLFRPYNGEKTTLPSFLEKDTVIEGVHMAKFKQLPSGYKKLTKEEIGQFRKDPFSSPLMPRQERGIRPSCAIPYELYVEGKLGADKNSFELKFRAGNTFFGDQAAGSPFAVYVYGKELKVRNYAVKAGDELTDSIPLDEFENGQYDLRVYGPNGFFRGFAGGKNDPSQTVRLNYERGRISGAKREKPTGRIKLQVAPVVNGQASLPVDITDNHSKNPEAAGSGKIKITADGQAGSKNNLVIDPSKSYGWYDFSVRIKGFPQFEQRYAGRVETGKDGYSDPAMA
ncbi:phosphocholine-specific phospholipase C [Flavitalea flava]